MDWPYELTDEERKLGPFGIVNKYLLSAFAGMDDPVAAGALPEWLREQDDKTLLEFAARRGASPGAQEMIRHGNWFGARSDTASAASTLTADLAPTHDTAPLAFVGGSGRRQDRVIADQVVCAIPFPVLRHIEAAPALSPAKQTVVNGHRVPLRHPCVSADAPALLGERRRGGERLDRPCDRRIATAAPHSYPRAARPGHPRGACPLGRGTPALDGMAEDERLRYVLEEMDKAHPGVGRHYEGGQWKSWQADRWPRGAYSLYRPGQISSWRPAASRQEGRIHFAGEHTSIFNTSMEGAIESGVRAAREIEAG